MYPESQDMFRRFVEASQSGIYMADAKGNLFYVNNGFVRILGYKSKDEVIGLNLANELYLNPKDREEFLNRMKEKGFVRNYEVQNVRKDGTVVILSATSNFLWDERGQVMGVEGVVYDITFNKKLEEALLTEKRKLEEILGFDEKISSIRKFDALIDFIVEKVSNILEVQRCSLMLVDENANELCIQGAIGLEAEIIKQTRMKLGEPIAGIVAQEGQPLLVKNIEYEKRFRRANRKGYIGRSFMVVPIKLEERLIGVLNVADKKSSLNREEVFTEIDLKILCAVAREVAVAVENVKLYKELNFLTVTDPLTQIFNYRHFSQTLDFELKRLHRVQENLALIMMDVDDFKSYNDTFGHLEGDTLLKEISKILKSHLRETDIVCRYAGDEFAIILPNTDAEGARNVAEKVREMISKHLFKRKVTASLGVAVYCDQLNQREFIMKADQALYQAKEEGRNKVCVNV